MAAKLSAAAHPVQHTPGAAVQRLDRAHARARYATARIPSRKLAEHWGCEPATARSFRTRVRSGPLTKVLELIADPSVDAAPIVAGLIAAWEERFICEPTDDLRARLKHLREVVEHRAQAQQDQALMVRDGSHMEACLQHAGVLIEIVVHEELLGEGAR